MLAHHILDDTSKYSGLASSRRTLHERDSFGACFLDGLLLTIVEFRHSCASKLEVQRELTSFIRVFFNG